MLEKGENIVFINSAAKLPLLFTLMNLTTNINGDSTAAAADTMQIGGYMRARKAQVTGPITGERPRPAKKHKLTVDSANAAQFALTDPLVVGEVLHFFVNTALMYGESVEMHNAGIGDGSGQQYARDNFFPIKVRPGDTTATILTRLAAIINEQKQVYLGDYPFSASFAGGIFTLEGRQADYKIVLEVWKSKTYGTPSPAVAAFKPVVATEQFEGVGQYENLHTYRLQTENRNEPYGVQQYESPIAGTQYTGIRFQTRTPRPDLTSAELADSETASLNTFTMWVADNSGAQSLLSEIIAFLAASNGAGITRTWTGINGTPVTQAQFLAGNA